MTVTESDVLTCGICDKQFRPYEGMRKPSTYGARYWCKEDQDEFDSIDWDEVREREMGRGVA